MDDDYFQGLLSRAERAFQWLSMEEVLERARNIVGPQIAQGSHPDGLAQRALTTLQGGGIPPPEELSALELMIRLMRPALLTSQGKVPTLPHELNGSFTEW